MSAPNAAGEAAGRGGEHSGARCGVSGDPVFFFSNRLGCLGSLVVSAVLTLLLLALLTRL